MPVYLSIFSRNSHPFLVHRNIVQLSNQSKKHQNTGIITKQSTPKYLPGSSLLPLLTARRSFLVYPLSLGAAPPVVSLLRSQTDHARSSASIHLPSFAPLLSRGQCPPRQPPAGVVLQQPRQRVLPLHVFHGFRSLLHLSPGLCRPTNPPSCSLLSSCAK